MTHRTDDKKRNLQVRFSERDPQQVDLYNRIEQDKLNAINISAVTRTLLLRWYEYRDATGKMDVPPFGVQLAGGTSINSEQPADLSDSFLAQLMTLRPADELMISENR